MLLIVTFRHAELLGCERPCARRRRLSLKPVFYLVLQLCVMKLTCAIVHHHHAWVWLKLCGCRRTSVPATSTSGNVAGCNEQLNLNTQALSV